MNRVDQMDMTYSNRRQPLYRLVSLPDEREPTITCP